MGCVNSAETAPIPLHAETDTKRMNRDAADEVDLVHRSPPPCSGLSPKPRRLSGSFGPASQKYWMNSSLSPSTTPMSPGSPGTPQSAMLLTSPSNYPFPDVSVGDYSLSPGKLPDFMPGFIDEAGEEGSQAEHDEEYYAQYEDIIDTERRDSFGKLCEEPGKMSQSFSLSIRTLKAKVYCVRHGLEGAEPKTVPIIESKKNPQRVTLERRVEAWQAEIAREIFNESLSTTSPSTATGFTTYSSFRSIETTAALAIPSN